MGRWDHTPTGDRPRSGQGDELRGSGSHRPAPDAQPPEPVPASIAPPAGMRGTNDRFGKAYAFCKREFVDIAGNGAMPSDEDFAALPAEQRSTARELCRRAVETFDTGDHQAARSLLAEGFIGLAGQLPRNWHPPARERPSRELLDEIQGRRW